MIFCRCHAVETCFLPYTHVYYRARLGIWSNCYLSLHNSVHLIILTDLPTRGKPLYIKDINYNMAQPIKLWHRMKSLYLISKVHKIKQPGQRTLKLNTVQSSSYYIRTNRKPHPNSNLIYGACTHPGQSSN